MVVVPAVLIAHTAANVRFSHRNALGLVQVRACFIIADNIQNVTVPGASCENYRS